MLLATDADRIHAPTKPRGGEWTRPENHPGSSPDNTPMFWIVTHAQIRRNRYGRGPSREHMQSRQPNVIRACINGVWIRTRTVTARRDWRDWSRQLPTQLHHVQGNPSRHAITVASTVRLEMYRRTGLSMCLGWDLRSTSVCTGQREPDSAFGPLWNGLGHILLLMPTPIPSMSEVRALVQRMEFRAITESDVCSCPPNEVFKPAAVRATATCYDRD